LVEQKVLTFSEVSINLVEAIVEGVAMDTLIELYCIALVVGAPCHVICFLPGKALKHQSVSCAGTGGRFR
jgi:hypothetical protein